MEVDLFDVGIVDLRFGCSQHFEYFYRAIFRRLADGRLVDDLADFLQPPMRVMLRMLVAVRVVMAMTVVVAVLFFLVLMVRVAVLAVTVVGMAVPGARGALLPRQFLFPGGDHVHFGSADAAAINARDLQTRIHTQGLHSPGEKLRRNASVHQGAKKHVATDAGKAL